jgi:hypothetical protein
VKPPVKQKHTNDQWTGLEDNADLRTVERGKKTRAYHLTHEQLVEEVKLLKLLKFNEKMFSEVFPLKILQEISRNLTHLRLPKLTITRHILCYLAVVFG